MRCDKTILRLDIKHKNKYNTQHFNHTTFGRSRIYNIKTHGNKMRTFSVQIIFTF